MTTTSICRIVLLYVVVMILLGIAGWHSVVTYKKHMEYEGPHLDQVCCESTDWNTFIKERTNERAR